MSTLVENVAKVKSAHAALSAAIEAKGVSVPAGTKLTGMPALVDQIQTGGGGGGEGGYLTFTAVEAATLKLMQQGSIAPHKLLKSTDGQNWTKWENPSTNGISLQAGESVYLKADEDAAQRMAKDNYNYNYFYIYGKLECTGDAIQLVKNMVPSDYQYCFCNFFKNCQMTNAPALPSTVLANNCYDRMFMYCTQLTAAPELPATTLANNCYERMFYNCTKLETVPALPSTVLANNCYDGMFYNCWSLKRIKMNASSGSWGTNMFEGCEALELVDMTGSTGVPTLSNVNNFQSTNGTYKVVVPDSLYDTWIAATNWASIASHIMKQSDWNAAHPDDQL